jgi:hypothetical protein
MPEQPAVTVSPPPDAFLKMVNPILRRLLRTPLAGSARNQFMDVSFTGRKSGKHYSIPVSAHRIDGTLYALTSSAWKNNFRDGATADIHLAGETTAMRGELVTDPAVVADLAHRLASAYGPKRAQRMMGLKFRDNQTPTLEQFTDAVQRERIAAVRFAPTS